jgi:N-acetylglutamate synthase-like GNAT family acetyltransferase
MKQAIEKTYPRPQEVTITIQEVTCYQLAFHEGNEVIGRAQLHTSNDHCLEVVDLFIEPEHRGNGHSRRILDELIVFARSRGAQELCAHAAPSNEPAFRAFTTMGFHRCEDEVHLEREIRETNSGEE